METIFLSKYYLNIFIIRILKGSKIIFKPNTYSYFYHKFYSTIYLCKNKSWAYLDREWCYFDQATMATGWERVFQRLLDRTGRSTDQGYPVDRYPSYLGRYGYWMRQCFNTPRSDIDREDHTIEWERIFLTLHYRTSTSQGKPINQFINRSSLLGVPQPA